MLFDKYYSNHGGKVAQLRPNGDLPNQVSHKTNNIYENLAVAKDPLN